MKYVLPNAERWPGTSLSNARTGLLAGGKAFNTVMQVMMERLPGALCHGSDPDTSLDSPLSSPPVHWYCRQKVGRPGAEHCQWWAGKYWTVGFLGQKWERCALIGRICQFPWYIYSQPGQFHATNGPLTHLHNSWKVSNRLVSQYKPARVQHWVWLPLS